MSTNTSTTAAKPVEDKRRKRIVTWTVIVVLLLVIADQAVRIWEFNQILSVAENSETYINNFKADFYAAQSDLASGVSVETVDAQIAARAKVAGDAIAADGEKLGAMAILPWHTSLEQALVDYKNHNAAWTAAADVMAIDGDGIIVRQSDIDLINSTWKVSLESFKAAMPILDLANFAGRLAEIEKG